MQIQLNCDKSINGSAGMQAKVERIVLQELKYLATDITRVEVHLSDENSIKSGSNDKRCLLEARVASLAPVSAEHRADTFEQAINGAAQQLARAVKSALDKAHVGNKHRDTIKRLEPDPDL